MFQVNREEFGLLKSRQDPTLVAVQLRFQWRLPSLAVDPPWFDRTGMYD